MKKSRIVKYSVRYGEKILALCRDDGGGAVELSRWSIERWTETVSRPRPWAVPEIARPIAEVLFVEAFRWMQPQRSRIQLAKMWANRLAERFLLRVDADIIVLSSDEIQNWLIQSLSDELLKGRDGAAEPEHE
jgi:hypothetical protein